MEAGSGANGWRRWSEEVNEKVRRRRAGEVKDSAVQVSMQLAGEHSAIRAEGAQQRDVAMRWLRRVR